MGMLLQRGDDLLFGGAGDVNAELCEDASPSVGRLVHQHQVRLGVHARRVLIATARPRRGATVAAHLVFISEEGKR